MPSGMGVEAAEVVEAGVAVETTEGVVAVSQEPRTNPQARQARRVQDTKVLSIQICLLVNGRAVLYIINTGVLHTSVRNLLLAHGKMFSFQDLKSDNQASSAPLHL